MNSDDCPFHELARTTPAETVQLYDENGDYIGPASAEQACDAYHAGSLLSGLLASAVRGRIAEPTIGACDITKVTAYRVDG